ncbi:hypothetical protein ACFLRY_05675, partial [Bacteroidota bacterium]
NNMINAVLVSCSIVNKEKEKIFDKLKENNPSLKIIGMINDNTNPELFSKKCINTNDIIQKPIDAEVLLKTLDKYLGNND